MLVLSVCFCSSQPAPSAQPFSVCQHLHQTVLSVNILLTLTDDDINIAYSSCNLQLLVVIFVYISPDIITHLSNR